MNKILASCRKSGTTPRCCAMRASITAPIFRKSPFCCSFKMDEEAASQLGEPSALPEDCRWGAIKDLQGEALAARYRQDSRQALSRHDGLIGAIFLKAQNEIQDPAKLRRLVT